MEQPTKENLKAAIFDRTEMIGKLNGEVQQLRKMLADVLASEESEEKKKKEKKK